MTRFYKSKEWLDLIKQLRLERVNEEGLLICEHCGKPIFKPYDCIAHHKIELTSANEHDMNVALNPNNIMLIHHRCHNIIHERFEGNRPQEVFIVYGSPCSGKTTWVHENASKDDLIIDIDSMWECLSVCDKYEKPNRLKANVFGVRDALLEQVKMRVGTWKRAYIIGGYPLRMERERLSDRLGAKLVFIDETKEICLSRAKNKAWEKYICDWFDGYQP